MDPHVSADRTVPYAAQLDLEPAQAVLAQVTCRWGESDEPATAVIVHAAREMLVLEATDPSRELPPLGTEMQVLGATHEVTGRVAEHGRAGRFLLSVGTRPIRRALRWRVSLPATMRCAALPHPEQVEIADLTTGGCRVQGVELPVGTQVTLDFTPPGREQPVMVRATVAHGTHQADRPWVGLAFRLVAMRGGR